MKKFECYDCEISFEAEARDEILGKLYDHYMKEHYAIITGGTEEEKKAWMMQFEKDWLTAKEI